MKKVLNLSRTIDIGSRFNNFSLRNQFSSYSWEPTFASWERPKHEISEISFAKNKVNSLLTDYQKKVSWFTGDINGYYRNANFFKGMEAYKQADLLHLHVIHEHFLSLKDWMSLCKDKPVVWTWHDPYPMHGHCIHSFDCERYREGCQSCPNLDSHFSIFRDRSFKNLKERAAVIEKINPLIIVASDWMNDKINNSVLADKIRVHRLPFGIKPVNKNLLKIDAIRSNLNIPKENIVIGMRADESIYKGWPLISSVLDELVLNYPYLPLTLIAFQEKNLLEKYQGTYQVVNLGWVPGEEIHDYFSLMDFFLMPSRAESFGLMAVEAMVNGVFPLVTYGTALSSLMRNANFSLISNNTTEDYLALLLNSILNVSYFRKERSELISWATQEYSSDSFVRNLTNIYSKEYARFHNF